jgi:site-specific DNA-methyltransferase (adenine-specific)
MRNADVKCRGCRVKQANCPNGNGERCCAECWHPQVMRAKPRPDFYDAASCYVDVRNALIWWKARGGMGNFKVEYARDYEVVLYGVLASPRPLRGKRRGAVLSGFAPVPPLKRLHPTEKPTSLMEELIERSCPPGGLVVDPFCGSGPVLEAAQKLGRRAIGIEIEERYCAAAAARLESR